MRCKKSLLALLLVCLIGVIFAFTACNDENENFNAIIFDRAINWVNSDIKTQSVTQGAFVDGEYANDESYPPYIINLVDSQQDFDRMFLEFPIQIDFDKKVLVVYVVTSNYMAADYRLQNILKQENSLQINIIRVQTADEPMGSATIPQQRCFAIVMDRIFEIMSENFEITVNVND